MTVSALLAGEATSNALSNYCPFTIHDSPFTIHYQWLSSSTSLLIFSPPPASYLPHDLTVSV